MITTGSGSCFNPQFLPIGPLSIENLTYSISSSLSFSSILNRLVGTGMSSFVIPIVPAL
jgi:hypothetical protein